MTAPNRADRIRQAMYWGEVAAAARARRDALAAELEVEARDELAQTGAAPTWRILGLGTVPLAVSRPCVQVVDEQAYIRWVAARHPTEVEELVRVRPAFDTHLREVLAKLGGPPTDDEGTLIPGLRYVPGGSRCDPTLQRRPGRQPRQPRSSTPCRCPSRSTERNRRAGD